MVDVGAIAAVTVPTAVAVMTWVQGQRAEKRSDFTVTASQLRQDLKTEKAERRREVGEERTQRKLLTRAYLDLWQWAKRVGPDTPAGPAPEPPAELDLSPWR
ncbi:hypothetical protein ACIRU8_10485 [Streptomyces sp. NPDC101175]|uniref:hypothetical protein n=1 Tax=Streptomyces sp. NPDC101175 TaxID=3366123 RepID=UPI0038381A6A